MMKNFYTFALGALLGLFSISTFANHHTVRVGGTGGSVAMMKIMAAAYQETNPDRHIVVVSGLGSNGGMRALASKKIDMAIVALPLNKEAQAINAVRDEYARTPYMITVNPSTTLADISTQELADILTGKIKNWDNGQVMRLVMRPFGDSDTKFMRSIDPTVDEAVKIALKREGIIVAPTDQDAADSIMNTPGAIGITTLAQNNAEKRGLIPSKLNGIEPSVENLESGDYVYYKSLSMVTWPQPSEAVSHFAKFIRSDIGTSLLKEYGHMILPRQ